MLLTTKKIIKEWTDYNNHMNVAYYVLVFDLYGAETLMNKFEMGEHSAKTTKKVQWWLNHILLTTKKSKKVTKWMSI